ncbi:Gfo/Idh/MocA family oxidoreductase [Enterovibrio sp. Hal110]
MGSQRCVHLKRLFAIPDIDCVLNLTIPAVHAQITLAALEAGKHVYSEKPLDDRP